ncbi:hypothetical protein [Paenibacillus daejeonensis]|uniref:hypothetical protein n=1 Tax=Paenibacillus daejeonensis TaxID=135193 RepID=UPI00035E3BB9|nr:hypothetical protein [Paenibacillus daejeonensis]
MQTKVIHINKPTTEPEMVNLYATVEEALRTLDPDLPAYFAEPNICDDCDMADIVSLFADYYESEDNQQRTLRAEEATDHWRLYFTYEEGEQV